MRYIIQERIGDAWHPAALPESPYTDDLPWALGILRALSSRRFRVRDTDPAAAVKEDTRRKRRDARRRAEVRAALAVPPRRAARGTR